LIVAAPTWKFRIAAKRGLIKTWANGQLRSAFPALDTSIGGGSGTINLPQ
jgi:hypothetical protein